MHEWLTAEHVAGLSGVDTRSLTRRLREGGTMQGWLYPATMGAEEARERAIRVDMREGSVSCRRGARADSLL